MERTIFSLLFRGEGQTTIVLHSISFFRSSINLKDVSIYVCIVSLSSDIVLCLVAIEFTSSRDSACSTLQFQSLYQRSSRFLSSFFHSFQTCFDVRVNMHCTNHHHITRCDSFKIIGVMKCDENMSKYCPIEVPFVLNDHHDDECQRQISRWKYTLT
jgi:hypothetical protein